MLRRTRTILFLILLLAFCLIAPLVVLYSQGYRLDFQNKKFLQTGGLFFKVWPADAEVYLSGKLQKKTSILFGQALIENLLPKTYEVEIKKEGYRSWQKSLEVKEKLVTEAKNIVLIPENPQFSLLDKNVEDFWFSSDGKKVIYNKNAESWVLEISNLESGPQLASVEELDFKGDELKEIPTPIKESLVCYQILNGDLIWLSREGFFYRSDLLGKVSGVFNLNPIEVKPETEYKILAKNFSKIFLKEGDSLFFLDPDSKIFKEVSDSVKNLKFSPDQKKIVYFNNHEIWVFFLEPELGQPQKATQEKVFLNRFSEDIGEVFWYTSYYLVFNAGNKIKVSEIDDRDKINMVDLAEFENPKIFWNKTDKKLYILSGGNLYGSERLLP